MSDYIKREDTLDMHFSVGLQDDSTQYVRYTEVKDNIKHIPTADVVEVRHGEWIYGENEEGHDGYRCSECGEFIPWEYDEYDIDFIKKVHYCPSCGAKMNREEQEYDK